MPCSGGDGDNAVRVGYYNARMKKLLFVVLLLVSASAAVAQSAWEVTRDVDPITDANASYASTSPTRFPEGAIGALLEVRCNEDASLGVEVRLLTGAFIGVVLGRDVTYRVDGGDVHVQRWDVSNSYDVAFTRSPIELLQRLRHASEVVLRLQGEAGFLTYVFPVTGAESAFQAIGCVDLN